MATLLAKSGPEWTPLKQHLLHVSYAAKAFAKYLGMDEDSASMGAILHDIGKAHPEFQRRLKSHERNSQVFRHEISSILFLSAFPERYHSILVEMVVGHHKSIKYDSGGKGLLDLEETCDYEKYHIGNWGEWSPTAFELLNELGIRCDIFDEKQAKENLLAAVRFCTRKMKERGYSEWRGLLMGADHYASALIDATQTQLLKAFKAPDLSFYNRTHELYPLSFKDTKSEKKHTIVLASTGAGKTDFLFKRTKGRVYYTLPFQASINAMFKRVAHDLEPHNPELDIRILHSASMVVKRNTGEEEVALQSLFGSSIKILTPHQLTSILFGTKGYEALLLDLKACDVILDEIHTYTGISQAIVLKLVRVLNQLNCRIHIGSATMPSALYNKILETLQGDVLEVKLSDQEMDNFDRHVIYKIPSITEGFPLIDKAIGSNEKILMVLNKVADAQQTYCELHQKYPQVPILLLHSRFKRMDRNEKERKLIGLDENGKPTGQFNTSNEACIVVSTQIVEVSLDISFDIMVTETAPVDSLIQRFGRINRVRSLNTIGQTKNIYVIKPSDNKNDAKPYDLEILKRSFEILPDGELLKERELQQKIDCVFPAVNFMNIEEHAIFKEDGRINIDKLTHRSKSILFELLDIDSVSCICEGDLEAYKNASMESRMEMEIPARYFNIRNMNQVQIGNKPFTIPDKAYDKHLGLNVKKISENNFNVNNQLL